MSNIKSILEINKLHVSYLFHIYLKTKVTASFRVYHLLTFVIPAGFKPTTF